MAFRRRSFKRRSFRRGRRSYGGHGKKISRTYTVKRGGIRL